LVTLSVVATEFDIDVEVRATGEAYPLSFRRVFGASDGKMVERRE